MGYDELDGIQRVYEQGDYVAAAAALREVRLLADQAGRRDRVSEIDDLIAQMRSHLTASELAAFDARLHGSGGRAVQPPARFSAPSVNVGRVSLTMIAGWLCCLLIAIGAIGPWVTTAFGQSASGLDGSNDSWIMLVGAIGAGLIFASFVSDSGRPTRMLRSVLIIGAGVGLLATGVRLAPRK